MTEIYTSMACVADRSEKAQEGFNLLKSHYNFCDDIEQADVIIALGGDGFMLHMMHEYQHLGKPIYGMNCGTVGFLMNNFREEQLREHLSSTKRLSFHPLIMEVTTADGNHHTEKAFNEVSLLRQTKQAAHIKISIDGHVRMEELVCDGILVATPAGSTAYNLSVHGPIIPIGSDLLALTPISPFRPRRWKGALLPHKAEVRFDLLQHHKRPVSAVADFNEIRDIVSVCVRKDLTQHIDILFDRGHSLEERIIGEQFMP